MIINTAPSNREMSADVINIFIGTIIDASLTGLVYNQPDLVVKPSDKAYYYIRADTELGADPFQIPNSITENMTGDITLSGTAVFDISANGIPLDLEFFDALGLVIKRDTLYYIHPHAQKLIDFFRNYRPNHNPLLRPLTKLLLTYILPGRYWSAYAARKLLPENVGESNALYNQMNDIVIEYNVLFYANPSP
jgi:hypothetical protein